MENSQKLDEFSYPILLPSHKNLNISNVLMVSQFGNPGVESLELQTNLEARSGDCTIVFKGVKTSHTT